MPNSKPPPKGRAQKAYTAFHGDNEFSVVSVLPQARKPLVELEPQETGTPENTPASRSALRLLRKIFSE